MRDEPPIELIDVDLIDLRVQPWHSCKYHSERDVTRLAESMGENGGKVDQPIALRRIDGPKPYAPIFGRRRTLALREAGVTQVAARTHDVDDETAAIMSLRENTARTQLDLLQRGWSFARLEDGGRPQVQICKLVGERPSKVSEGIAFARALPEALLLQELADLNVTNPQELVYRTARLSKRTLMAIRDAALVNDHGPLRVALRALVAGKSKVQTTRAVSKATRREKATKQDADTQSISLRTPARHAEETSPDPTQLLAEIRTALEHATDLLELAAVGNPPRASNLRRSRPSLLARLGRWIHKAARAVLSRFGTEDSAEPPSLAPLPEE
jgi:ParB/RepB/Spo0J family partition protein